MVWTSRGAVLVLVLLGACGEIREVPVQAADSDETGAGAATSDTGSSSSDGSSSGTTQGATSSGDSSGSSESGSPRDRETLCSSTSVTVDPVTGEATLELTVEGIGAATDLDVAVRLYHEAVGKVQIDLHRGVDRSITLFPLLDRSICTPDLSVRFDADAELTAADACELESTDGTMLTVAPVGDLATILAGDADGFWAMTVTDSREAPAGELASFCLSFATGA